VRLVLGEAVMIGLLGGLLGIVATTIAFRGGVQLTPGPGKLLQAVQVSKLEMVVGLLTSIMIPLTGALPSALLSMRMPLVDALRDTA
jgi:ABC-type antimicrobial peptide transport system permease subunit